MENKKNNKTDKKPRITPKPKPDGGEGDGKKPGGSKFNFSFYWIYGIIIVVLIGTQLFNSSGGAQKITYQDFKNEYLSTGDVDHVVVVNKELVEVYIKKDKLKEDKFKAIRTKGFGNSENDGPHFQFAIGSVDQFNKQLDEDQKALNIPESQHLSVDYETDNKSFYDTILGWIVPIGLLLLFWMFIMRRMGGGGGASQIFSIGKSKAQLFDKDLHVKVTFNDVAGLEEAKVEVMEIVDFLKTPKKYTMLGGKIPRGALLVGPPGTGKTLLAKAVAGEAQVPFFSLSGSDFVEMFVGVGASRVRDLFRQAKEKAPCIIFIDEIDAIGRAREVAQL